MQVDVNHAGCPAGALKPGLDASEEGATQQVGKEKPAGSGPCEAIHNHRSGSSWRLRSLGSGLTSTARRCLLQMNQISSLSFARIKKASDVSDRLNMPRAR